MAAGTLLDSLRSIARAHPVLSLSVPTIAVAWIAFLTLIGLGLDPSPAVILLSLFFVVVQIVVGWLIGGWAEVRYAFGRLLRFRFSPLLWMFVLLGAPLATLGVAAISGTLQAPEGGWPALITNYLLFTFVIGALLVNLWEESLWGGMVQTRLMERHGLLTGSLLSAIPFALVHLPLAFGAAGFFGTPADRLVVLWAAMIGSAPFFRYLMGMVLIETRGSTLAIGLLHASWNACSSLAAVNGGWQYLAGLVVLVAVLAGWRLARGQSPVDGRVPEAGSPASSRPASRGEDKRTGSPDSGAGTQAARS